MDLTTRYLGLTLKNPLVASAGPLNRELDNVRRLEDCGAAAVVLPSVFEEQIAYEQDLIDQLIATGRDSYAEALTYFLTQAAYAIGPERYLDLEQRARQAVGIPVIGSVNGVSNHGWVNYAREIEAGGAAAIELNVYFIASDLDLSEREVEQRCVDILKAVKRAVKIPVAIKLGPYFSAFGHMARQLDQAGADGLVLFNRFYEPDIDLMRMALVSCLELSSAYEMRLPLLWVGVLAGRLKASLVASTGVDRADDVVKYLLAGADVVMTTSSLLRHGIGHVRELLGGIETWLEARDLDSLATVRGRLSHRNVVDAGAFERANYIKTLQAHKA